MDEDFEELPEEEHPEKLRKKWEKEDFDSQFLEKGLKNCPHCGKWIANDTFTCIYCGGRVFHESGLLGRMAHWFSKGIFFWVLLVFVAIMVFSLVRL